MTDGKREMLRHTLATLVYRGGKMLRGATPEFSGFAPHESARTPGEILAHIGDLLDWALTLATGRQAWKNSPVGTWDQDVDRFYASLQALDEYLASEQVLHAAPEHLFQGPVADALTHVGQIGMLRRMAGIPVRGENYFQAGMKVGNVGSKQESPAFEFN